MYSSKAVYFLSSQTKNGQFSLNKYAKIYTSKIDIDFSNMFLKRLFYLLSSVMQLCLTFSGVGLFHSLIQQIFIVYLLCALWKLQIQRQIKHDF